MPNRPSVSFLLVDEHFPDVATFYLRRLGHDVMRVRDLSVNKAGDGHSDAAVLAEAVSRGRTVVTQNCADFLALHKKSKSHCGIIGSKQFSDLKKQAKQIDKAIRAELRKHGNLDGLYIRVPYEEHAYVAPPGLSSCVPLSRGLRPWLNYAAPTGAYSRRRRRTQCFASVHDGRIAPGNSRSASSVRCMSGASGASNVTSSPVMGCTNRRLRACRAWRDKSNVSFSGDVPLE